MLTFLVIQKYSEASRRVYFSRIRKKTVNQISYSWSFLSSNLEVSSNSSYTTAHFCYVLLVLHVYQSGNEFSQGKQFVLFAVQTCLPTNRVVAGCEKMAQKVASSSTFLQQNLYMLRVLPAQDELVLQQVT